MAKKNKPIYDREHAERIYDIVSNYTGVCSPETLHDEDGLSWSEVISQYESAISIGIKDAELKGYVSKAVDAILRDCLMEEALMMAKLEEICKEEI